MLCVNFIQNELDKRQFNLKLFCATFGGSVLRIPHLGGGGRGGGGKNRDREERKGRALLFSKNILVIKNN